MNLLVMNEFFCRSNHGANNTRMVPGQKCFGDWRHGIYGKSSSCQITSNLSGNWENFYPDTREKGC